MEKRVLLAAILSAIFLSWYSQAFLKPPMRQKPALTQAVAPDGSVENTPASIKPAMLQPLIDEPVIRLESQDLLLELGTTSGAIRSVTLKQYPDEQKTSPLVFRTDSPVFQLTSAGVPLEWKFISQTTNNAIFEAEDEKDNDYHISYSLSDGNGLVSVDLSYDITGGSSSVEQDIVYEYSWERSDQLTGQQNPLEIHALQKKDNGQLAHKKLNGSPNQTKNVPRGTILFSLAERYFCQSVRFDGPVELAVRPSKNTMLSASTRALEPDGDGKTKTEIYFGPRDYFHMKRVGFDEAFKIGWLGQIGLILLSILKGIAGITKNYGIAIILLCAIITTVTAPFTIISFKSLKKMQDLKPKIDLLMVKHKDDSPRLNKEIFALYKEHRVSPMSGCLPMLLQMPIFIALLQAISHFIDLRGQPFLWIKDLSLPDRFMALPVSVPIIGSYINLLPVLMAGAMFLQSKFTQTAPPDANNPTAKLMSGPFMSILFGFMFYQFPSGLVLYWLSNSLISVLFFRLAK